MKHSLRSYASIIILNTVGKNDSNVTYEEAEPFTKNIKTINCSKAINDLKHDPISLQKKVSEEWMKWYYRL